MVFIALIGATSLLLASFLLLTRYELRNGTRVMAGRRNSLDRVIGQVTFVATHVDFVSFVQSHTRGFANRIGHDIAHIALRIVRTIERLLTRAVRTLRHNKHPIETTAPSDRAFIGALSSFKKEMNETRPSDDELHNVSK